MMKEFCDGTFIPIKQKDNYTMIFIHDHMPKVYEKIKKDWLGEIARLGDDDIFFYCRLIEFVEIFYDNNETKNLKCIRKHIYIYNFPNNEYYLLNYNSFKSEYSKLKKKYKGVKKIPGCILDKRLPQN